MSNIIPFGQGAALPAYLANRAALAHINADVASAPSVSVLSIKGKVFTLVKGKEKKVLTREVDGEQEPVSSMSLSVVRANKNARVFYAKAYSEEDSEGAKPTCYSGDGVAPAGDAAEPQAKKCQLCPHAVWGSKAGDTGKGTACSVNTRLAVVDPTSVGEPWLLRVPAGSRQNFADACKMADTRGLPYNAVVFKVAFDPAAPSPKLTFKPVGLLSDDAYAKVTEMYEGDEVKEIVGLTERAPLPALAAPVEADELDAALAARKAAPAPAPAPAPVKAKPAPVSMDELDDVLDMPAPAKTKPAPKAKPAPVEDVVEVAAPAPAPAPAKPATKAAVASGMDDLLGDLDDLLGSTDD